MATFTWTGQTGNWGDAASWSPAGPPAGILDFALLNAAGPYTATIADGDAFVLGGGTLATADAILDLAGTLTLDTRLLLSGGILLLQSTGTIAGGTIEAAGGTFQARGGTLADTRWLGPLTLDDGADLTAGGTLVVGDALGGGGTISFGGATTMRVLDSLLVNQGTSAGTIEMFGNFSFLDFQAGGTLDRAHLDFRGNVNIVSSPNAPLLLGAGLTADLTGDDVEFQGNFVNQATILVNAGTTYIEDIEPLTQFDNQASIAIGAAVVHLHNDIFLNSGQVSVGTGGTLSVGAEVTLANTGTITLDAGATLSRHDRTTLSGLAGGGIVNNGGTLEISALLDLEGGTMDIAPTGLFSFVDVTADGTVANGTVVLNGGVFSPSGGTLDTVTHQGHLVVPDFEAVNAIGGLRVTDASGANPGTVSIGQGSTLNITGGLTVATAAGPGTIAMTGDFATLDFHDSATLDQARLTVNGDVNQLWIESAVLTLGTAMVVDLSVGTFYAYGGLVNQGTIQQDAGVTFLSNWDVGDAFVNQGLLSVGNTVFALDLSVFTNTGTVLVGANSGMSISAETTFSSGGRFVIQGGGALDLGAATGATITFDGAGLLALATPDNFTGLLHDFGTGGQLELTGVTIESAAIVSTTLTVNLTGGGSLAYTVDPGLDGIAPMVVEGREGTLNRLVMPCFLAGTRILTARGPVAVEMLREGDEAVTASGGHRPIRWIGRRAVDCRRHPRPAAVHPIRVAPDAFGPNQPSRALYLSPDHAVLRGDVLIPVKYLVNGTTIRAESRASVLYFHVELDRHDVILAEGLAAESYLDTGDRSAFANGGGATQLHPVFGPIGPATRGMWEAFGCARLVVTGAELDKARAVLAARAATLQPSARGPSFPALTGAR